MFLGASKNFKNGKEKNHREQVIMFNSYMCTLHGSVLAVLSSSPGRSSKSFNLDGKEMIKMQAWITKEGGDLDIEVSIIHMMHACMKF